MWMDRSYPTSHNTPSQQCKKSYLHSSTTEHPKDERTGQILHWKGHLPSKENSCCASWWDPNRIPTTSKGIQQRRITTTTPPYHLGPCSQTAPGSSNITT